MKVLLLGYSSLARRRVLPALKSLGVTSLDMASASSAGSMALPPDTKGALYAHYHDALAQSDADLVYISTVNASHEDLATRALLRGKHVVVDKPAFLSLAASERLVALARERGLCIAEATVYAYHPAFAALVNAFQRAGNAPTRLVGIFSFPLLPENNFRYQQTLGGGAILDLGPYAITPGRILFQAEPETLECVINERATEVETAFSVLLQYPGGRSMVGHYGMNTGYINRLDVLGPGMTATIERVFSPPSDAPIKLSLSVNNTTSVVEVPAADSFVMFLGKVLAAVESGATASFSWFGDDLLADAKQLERLRRVAR